MALLFPLGLKASADSKVAKALPGMLQSLVTYFFVNPEKMKITRDASIAEARTMGGTVFQPWPNMPDKLEFSGILYGTRAIVDALILDFGMPSSPDNKQVELIYKWKKYPGYVTSLSISADAEKPRVFNYSFNFVSTEAVQLYRIMLGQLTGTSTETSFLNAQSSAAAAALKAEQLNVISAVVAAATGGMGVLDISAAALRSVLLYAIGSSLSVSKRKRLF
jgi:hypothetical protein